MTRKIGSYRMPLDIVPESIQKEFARLEHFSYAKQLSVPMVRVGGLTMNEKVRKFAEEHDISFADAVSAFASHNPVAFVAHLKDA
jgi:hypothetical protein